MEYRFDSQFVKRFAYLCTKLRSRLVFHLFLTLLLIRLLQEYVYYRVGLVTSEYYKILAEKNLNGFLWLTVKSLTLFATVSLIKSSSSYLASIFYVTCRQKLTRELHLHYFSDKVQYHLNVYDKNQLTNYTDNPDQRITQDTDKLCSTLSNVLPMLMISPFTIAYYSYSSYASTGWVGPISVLVYFLFSTFINKLLMSPVVTMVYLQEKCEGYFRYQHMHVRINSEAIAFQNGENIEREKSNEQLRRLINTQEKLFLRKYPLDTSVNLFNYFGSIISFLVLAVPIFTGLYDNLSSADLSALISKNTFVTMYLISCFSNLINLSDDFTTLAGTSHRVAQLLKKMEDQFKYKGIDNTNFKSHESVPRVDASENSLLRVRNLNFCLPEKEEPILSSSLSFTVDKENNCLLVGKSGIGKTSVFRVLKGLWPPSNGSFKFNFPTDNCADIFYLPQKAFLMPNGSLREQIYYPKIVNERLIASINDDEIERLMKECDLSSLISRLQSLANSSKKSFLDVVPDWNWFATLSPGETQRVCFTRLFCHRPALALVDEPLSAVSSDVQSRLYSLCQDMKITLLTIGHDQQLKRHHAKVVSLDVVNKENLVIL